MALARERVNLFGNKTATAVILPSISLASEPKVVGSTPAGRMLSAISDAWSVTRIAAAPGHSSLEFSPTQKFPKPVLRAG